jgi:8-oxo-dGTP pyrophosphatase MutT (NUDIX family)
MADWERQYDDEVQEYRIFRVRRYTAVSPRTGRPGRYVTIQAPDWANVVAIAADGTLILVRQYRHGVDATTLEIPAGTVEAGEDPLAAMQRELAEESGYVSDRWTHLGSVHPNPAFQDNVCHHYLALDCARAGEQQLDAGEDIEVVNVPLGDVERLIRDGVLNHALEIAAFFRYVEAGQPGGIILDCGKQPS